jgi:hypothetical protein
VTTHCFEDQIVTLLLLKYERRMDEDAEGPVERTTGPVRNLNVPKIPVSDVRERERERKECA